MLVSLVLGLAMMGSVVLISGAAAAFLLNMLNVPAGEAAEEPAAPLAEREATSEHGLAPVSCGPAEEQLRQYLHLGEIDDEEYRRRLAELRTASAPAGRWSFERGWHLY